MLDSSHPEYIQFPDPNLVDDQGFIGHGADLEIPTLISAYQQGIFPWFSGNEPILWWSPNPRMILQTENMRISRSLKKLLRSGRFKITCGEVFSDVIDQCSKPRISQAIDPTTASIEPRAEDFQSKGSLGDNAQIEDQTWITDDMKQAYLNLHDAGYAQSIECWENEKLVGGLYGVSIAGMYFGESMFSQANNSSKVALAHLCHFLQASGVKWIDCQVESEHLVSLGAININRNTFIEHIQKELESPIQLNWNDFEKINNNYQAWL